MGRVTAKLEILHVGPMPGGMIVPLWHGHPCQVRAIPPFSR